MHDVIMKGLAIGVIFTGISSTMTAEATAADFFSGSKPQSTGYGQYSLKDPYGIGNSNSAGVGFLEAATGYSFGHDNDNTANSYALRGSYGRIVGDQWAVQIDAKYEYVSLDYGTITGDIDEFAGTLHLSKKFNDKFAAGAFVQGGLIGADLWTQYSAGAEAAMFLDSVTLYGRAAYAKASIEDEDADAIIGTVGARVYAKDNLRFDVEGKLWEDNTEASVAGLYRLPNYNTTLSLGYRYNANSAGAETQSASTIFGAVRYHFGAATLREEERNGLHWGAVR